MGNNNQYPHLTSLIREGVYTGHSNVQHDENNFPERTYSPITLFSYSLKKRAAFTLAEVLITLGIIGIVAAMTMPALISKYRHKTLETAFKKSYSELLQITQYLPNEFGSCSYSNAQEVIDFFASKYNKVSDKIVYYDKYVRKCKTYSKQTSSAIIHFNVLALYSGNEATIISLPSGAVIGFREHDSNQNLLVTIDTNGPNKAPNAFGHDLFFFHFDNECKLVPQTGLIRDCEDDETDCGDSGWKWVENIDCSKNSTSNTNGFSCGKFAISNTCPDGSGKTYWDCLP